MDNSTTLAQTSFSPSQQQQQQLPIQSIPNAEIGSFMPKKN
jgi:hypothetical protein